MLANARSARDANRMTMEQECLLRALRQFRSRFNRGSDGSNFGRVELTEVALVDQPPVALWYEAGVAQPLTNFPNTDPASFLV